MSSQQLFQTEKDLLNSIKRLIINKLNNFISAQNRHVDDLLVAVGGIKTGQENINKELRYQNEELLPRLEVGVDRNLKHAKRADGKIVELLKKADNCKLYMIIAVEVLILVFLILAF